MAYANECQPMTEKKTCDAERVLNQLTEAVSQANELAEYAASRLSQLLPPEPPCAVPSPGKEVQMMAPLFNEYRVRIRDAQESMSRIRRMLERIEV